MSVKDVVLQRAAIVNLAPGIRCNNALLRGQAAKMTKMLRVAECNSVGGSTGGVETCWQELKRVEKDVNKSSCMFLPPRGLRGPGL